MKTLPALLLAVLATAATVRGELVAHYAFDGDANDSTAGAHHLTPLAVDGVTFPVISATGGRTGGFARFDGQSLLNTTWLPVTGNADRSLMLFFRTTVDNTPNGGTATMFFGGWGSPEAATRIRFDLGFENNSVTTLRNEYNAGFTVSTGSAEALNLGRWHHAAVVWSSATNTASFYLDGQPVGSATAAGALNTGGGAVDVGLSVGGDTRAAGRLSGASTQTPNRYFTGDIDEVRVYDHALSPEEVAGYYETVQDLGPALYLFEADAPVSAPGTTRTLRWQLSTLADSAEITPGIGSVFPLDSIGFGSLEVTPEETTDYRLEVVRGGETSVATVRIEVSAEPRILSFDYLQAASLVKCRLFLPDAEGTYVLERTPDLGDGWPETVGFFGPPRTGALVDFTDQTPLLGTGFYRLRQQAAGLGR